MIWEPEQETGLWISSLQVGDVGGTVLSIFGALWSPEADYIAGHGFHGAFQIWKKELVCMFSVV